MFCARVASSTTTEEAEHRPAARSARAGNERLMRGRLQAVCNQKAVKTHIKIGRENEMEAVACDWQILRGGEGFVQRHLR